MSQDNYPDNIPPQVKGAYRVTLELNSSQKRLDTVLLQALRDQSENINLKHISRMVFKDLFKEGKILIKGQRAKTSSAVAKGTTYVDIIGY
jgi:ribosomal 50S subunit-recycling heat shock protein